MLGWEGFWVGNLEGVLNSRQSWRGVSFAVPPLTCAVSVLAARRVCMHCMYLCMCLCKFCIYMYVYLYIMMFDVCMQACIYMFLYSWIYVHVCRYVCACLCMYIWICKTVHTYVCMYVCIEHFLKHMLRTFEEAEACLSEASKSSSLTTQWDCFLSLDGRSVSWNDRSFGFCGRDAGRNNWWI